MFLPREVETRENGLIVRFNSPIDPASLQLSKAFCEQWNYLYSSAYGSGEYSPRNPGRLGHDPVAIRSLHALDDGRSVFIEIPQLHPVMQFHLYLEFQTADGRKVTPDIYYSIFQLGKPFTGFAGYRPIPKQPFPEFPTPEAYPLDPRLAAQEKLGKSTGEFETAVVNCVPGLQFEPRRIRMRAGRRAALILKNLDVEMPHNLVVSRPERVEAIGAASMKLAMDPSATARHYVPDDPGVIAMSSLIHPGEQYAIYFNTPKQPGEYPFLCTFPGHWVIMRGVLEVVE
jgi:azurin